MCKPQCLIYSAAMVMNEDPQRLIEEIGHDGMDIWWPQLKSPMCYRGHSISEVIDVSLTRGYRPVRVVAMPYQSPSPSMGHLAKLTYPDYEQRFIRLLDDQAAILIGMTPENLGHAWAWDGHHVFDPNGFKTTLDANIHIREAWVF
jgi:hypothetical protein